VDLEEQVRRQMDAWFAAGTREWELLRIDRIPHAVPFQREAGEMPARLGNGLYICGDHCGIASLNTALVSGTAAAEAILEDLA
jgi:predicted NAD/FAD-dependent oxidoreductase